MSKTKSKPRDSTKAIIGTLNSARYVTISGYCSNHSGPVAPGGYATKISAVKSHLNDVIDVTDLVMPLNFAFSNFLAHA